MKVLIDIGHPAHVHYFKNFYRIFKEQGHEIMVTAREKDISHELLSLYDIPFISRGKGGQSMLGKLFYIPKGNWGIFKHAIKFKPDVFLSFSSPYAAQVSSLMGKPHVAFDDTEHAKLARLMYRPFTDLVLSPKCYSGELGKRQQLFEGYMELSYLHPNQFQPREEVLSMLGLEKGEKFTIMRFVSWEAAHDLGHSGISVENKRRAVDAFSKFGKVFISSEGELPDDLKKYEFKLPYDWMHDALFYAQLFYGESATMASEAAMLGVPGIYLDNTGRGYTDELEKDYGIVFNFTESEVDQKSSIQKGQEILSSGDTKLKFKDNHDQIIADKIDLTAFLVKKIESYQN